MNRKTNAAGVKNHTKPIARNAKYQSIDKSNFENLCSMQCSKREIAGFFRVTPGTIDRFCQYAYGMDFNEANEMFSANGKVSLKRACFKKALNGDTITLIWAMKNICGWKDKVEQENTSRIEFINDVKEEDDNK